MKSNTIVFLLILFSQIGVAFSQSTPFDVAIQTGKTAYESGDYKVASSEFLKAYKLRPTSSLLYNIARCYDASGKMDEAADYYERFIKAPGISQTSRADAVSRLKSVREIKSMQEEDEKKNQIAEAEKKEKLKMLNSPKPLAEKKESKSSSTSSLSWVLIGLGGASIGAGVVTGVFSQSKYDDLEAMGFPDKVSRANSEEAKSLKKSGQTLQLSSIVLMGAGSALVVGGIVTYFVTKPNSSESAWLFQPAFSDHSASLQLTRTW